MAQFWAHKMDDRCRAYLEIAPDSCDGICDDNEEGSATIGCGLPPAHDGAHRFTRTVSAAKNVTITWED